MTKLSESEKNDAIKEGFDDAKSGDLHPPKGDAVADAIFAPVIAASGGANSQELAKAKSPYWREGVKAAAGSSNDTSEEPTDKDDDADDKDED